MSYDAGSIDAELRLDRTPFQQGLRDARREADAFERKPIKARLELDTAKAMAHLAAFRREVDARPLKLDLKIDTTRARREIAELRTEIERLNNLKVNGGNGGAPGGGGGGGGGAPGGGGGGGAQDVNKLRLAIELLAPAIVTTAGGLLALSSSVVGFGITGVLAFKGVKEQMDKGTAAGQQYGEAMRQAKDTAAALEAQAARALAPGIGRAASTLQARAPELTPLITGSASRLGDIADHAVDALVGGLKTFTPLIIKAEDYVDKLVTEFDTWANGPGGAAFADRLSRDFDKLVPLLAELGPLIVKIVDSLDSLGGGGVDTLTQIAALFNHFPTSAIKAATAAYLAFRVASTIGGLGGPNLGGQLAGLRNIAAGYAGLAIGVTSLASATDSWANSSNAAARNTHTALGVASGLLTFNYDKAWGALQEKLENDYQRFSAKQAQETIDNKLNPEAGERSAQRQLQIMKQIDDARAKYVSNTQSNLSANVFNPLEHITGLGDYSKSLGDMRGQLSKSITEEQKWTDTSKGATVAIQGHTYSVQAFDRATAATHGNVNQAIGLLEGHVAALKLDEDAQKQLTAQQSRLSNAIGAAETKYKLTDEQLQTYTSALGITAEQLARGTISQSQFVAEVGRVKGAVDNGSMAMDGWITALGQFNPQTATAADRAKIMGAAMVALNGDAISYGNSMAQAAVANQGLVTAFRSMDRSLLNTKTGLIDFHNAGSAPVLSALQQMQTAAQSAAEATYRNELATSKGTLAERRLAAAKAATRVYYNDTHNALVNEASQLGITRGEAEKLADRYFHWPKDAKTQIAALGAKSTNDILVAIGKLLADISGKSFDFYLNGHTTMTYEEYNKRLATPGTKQNADYAKKNASFHAAAGGTIRDGFFTVGEGGPGAKPELAYKQGSNLRVWSNADSAAAAARYGLDAPGLRPGGVPVPMHESGGFSGIATDPSAGTPSNSAEGARLAAQQRAQARADKYGSAADALFDSLDPVRSQARLNRLKKKSSDAIESVVSAMVSAFNQANDAKMLPNRLVKRFHRDNDDLNKALRDREKWEQKLSDDRSSLASARSNLRQYGDQVRDTTLGTFDVTSSGNGSAYGIQASVKQAVSDDRRFESLIARAKRMHLDPRLVEQFESKGPSSGANLAAIVNAGQGYVNSLDRDYGKLAGMANRDASTAMRDNVEINRDIRGYQQKIARDQREVVREQRQTNKWLTKVQRDTAQANRLARAAATSARKRA